ncbi:thiamine pyrophosphate protein domain protein TPP-binding protein [Desulfarculus baarsii DSM 2075]|uniref:Thiamine pyrophosphate protein domain protein TPP-binding protein n=1 Tax=Desulfarculus baarsii (strain ATCC 33931 / DSM 2075 / LMG 7858 / VKM B-1802 / 2st14) TaxID=644282 RepID=E1QJI1_DESB2|nr:thiamine pyrophosphate-dependent enzyme [Desulfarculus baarsii]ADK85724.1 thiamine pyrophosphate protein domain protein TPP-binding protein [Desulfarculus baarsii DSM 2075]
MKKVFEAPKSLKPNIFHYCPGCGHSIIHRLVAEVIDELGFREEAIGVPPAGCAVLAYNYFDVDMGEAPHGRALAVATGIKRVLPQKVVFTYQGDGDIAAIGTAETIHAANRGERITAIFVNNGVYGMTGGQMAPTTLPGMYSTTTPGGRDVARDGSPLNLTEMLAIAKGSVYLERVAVTSPAKVNKAKKAIKKAFQAQIDNLGFSLVEVLSPCPTNWKMQPVAACQWVEEEMTRFFPLGVIKDETGYK